VQIEIILQILNLNSYTRLTPNHPLNNFLKSIPLYQRCYSTMQSPMMHMGSQKSSLKGLLKASNLN
jgi:hypothetical protein